MRKNKKNLVTQKFGKNKRYNPNTLNATDGALVFIIVLIVLAVFSFLFSLAMKELSVFLEDYYVEFLVISTLMTQGLVLAVGLIYSLTRRVGFLSGGGYRFKKDSVNTLFGVILAVGLALLLSPVHSAFSEDMINVLHTQSIGNISFNEETANYSLLILYAFVLVPILPAVCEECIFRGIVLRGLEEKGALFAVVASSAMFALFHGNFEQLILQFFVGLAIGTAVILTKNFFIGAIMHFSYNLLISVIQIMLEVVKEQNVGLYYLLDAITIVCGVVFVLVSVIYFAKMIMAKQKAKILNKPQVCKTDIPLYAMLMSGDGGTLRKVEYYELGESTLKYSEMDERFIFGKHYVKFNKKSKKGLFNVLFVVSIVLAVALLVFEYFI